MGNKEIENAVLKDMAFTMKMVAVGMFAVLLGIVSWLALIWFCSLLIRALQ